MLKLGSFAQLPGNRPHADWAHPARFAVLVDARTAHQGQILQHPRYSALARQPATLQELLGHSTERASRVAGDWTWLEDYQDPLETPNSAAQRQRWLAARRPVNIRGENGGLDVIVQESYAQAIGEPLAELRRGLILLSLITLGLCAAVIVPLWAVIWRLVR
jgi:hypothetical protein